MIYGFDDVYILPLTRLSLKEGFDDRIKKICEDNDFVFSPTENSDFQKLKEDLDDIVIDSLMFELLYKIYKIRKEMMGKPIIDYTTNPESKRDPLTYKSTESLSNYANSYMKGIANIWCNAIK